jgi:hypothetical protein
VCATGRVPATARDSRESTELRQQLPQLKGPTSGAASLCSVKSGGYSCDQAIETCSPQYNTKSNSSADAGVANLADLTIAPAPGIYSKVRTIYLNAVYSLGSTPVPTAGLPMTTSPRSKSKLSLVRQRRSRSATRKSLVSAG